MSSSLESIQHRRRSGRLDPAARTVRPGGTGARRARHAALPALAYPRETHHPRPPQVAARPRHLALARRVPDLLAAPDLATSTRLTSSDPPRRARKGCQAQPGPVETGAARGDMRRPVPPPRGTKRAEHRVNQGTATPDGSRPTRLERHPMNHRQSLLPPRALQPLESMYLFGVNLRHQYPTSGHSYSISVGLSRIETLLVAKVAVLHCCTAGIGAGSHLPTCGPLTTRRATA